MKITAHNRDDKSGRIEIEPETLKDERAVDDFRAQLDRAQIKWWFTGAQKLVVVAELA